MPIKKTIPACIFALGIATLTLQKTSHNWFNFNKTTSDIQLIKQD